MHKKIYLSAPSSLPRMADNPNFLRNALKLMKENGCLVTANMDLLSGKYRDLYYSAPLDIRSQDFINALESEDDIIWAYRGGCGAIDVAHVILNKDIKPKIPKTLVGFSDITVLHVLFNQFYNLPTIHGDVATKLGQDEYMLNEILDLILGKSSINYPLEVINENNAPEVISGITVGTNLKILETLIGTKLQPNLDDKILLLEDIDERGYSVDRSLEHIYYAGMLEKTKAIIFGDFANSNEPDGTSLIKPTIERFSRFVGLPCYEIKDFGHTPINRPVILGAQATITNNHFFQESKGVFNDN